MNEDRPQFERLIKDLEDAKNYWNRPKLRGYSRCLLKIVGSIALAESVDPDKCKVIAE